MDREKERQKLERLVIITRWRWLGTENVVFLYAKHCTKTVSGRTSVSQRASFPACVCLCACPSYQNGKKNTRSEVKIMQWLYRRVKIICLPCNKELRLSRAALSYFSWEGQEKAYKRTPNYSLQDGGLNCPIPSCPSSFTTKGHFVSIHKHCSLQERLYNHENIQMNVIRIASTGSNKIIEDSVKVEYFHAIHVCGDKAGS